MIFFPGPAHRSWIKYFETHSGEQSKICTGHTNAQS